MTKKLFVVGTGPGDLDYLPAVARNALAASTDIVGYSLYIDLLGDLAAGKVRHDRALGEEAARVQQAIELAAEGKVTALVSSGDIGIYAMATLVFELLEQQARPEWDDIDVEVIPGISAMQVAAARSGAPLGHDFCTVSLSDLLTPWEAIEKRLKAAAEGDFVVSFYNPVSKKRDWQLAKAREILLQHRPADTPVVIARNLGREGECVTLTTLDALRVEQVDMLTMVTVGNSETRRWKERVYTPRGYAGKQH